MPGVPGRKRGRGLVPEGRSPGPKGSCSTYQWQRNGVAIAGATASTYTTPATVVDDADAVFTCVVSNAQGGVTSAGATLTVLTASQGIAFIRRPDPAIPMLAMRNL